MKTRQSVLWLPIEKLRRHTGNIREDVGDVEELARSIAEHGILQPLILTEHPVDSAAFLILAGHRRLAAACRAGMTSVPVIIRHDLGDDSVEQVVVMLVENCQRRDLKPLEKAEAYGSLLNRGLTQTDIARRTGMHVSTIAYYLALLDLDDDSRDQVAAGSVKSTDAIAAVRADRQRTRRAGGTPDRGRPVVVEAAHLTRRHALAPVVGLRCDHTVRPKVGGVGCGQCWEAVIREDAVAPVGTPPPSSFDEVAVMRRLAGDTSVPISGPERREVIRRAHKAGLNDVETARRTGIPARTVLRIRQELGLVSDHPAAPHNHGHGHTSRVSPTRQEAH